MSFFYWFKERKLFAQGRNATEHSERKHFIEKYMKEPAAIWGFALLLAVSCLFVNKMEQLQDGEQRKEVNIYHLSWDEGNEVDWMNNIQTTDEQMVSTLKENIIETDGETVSEDNVPSNLYAKYALLMDATNRRVLYEKSGYEQVPMASTTKIMTLLVTLENANLEDMVTVSEYASTMPDVQLNIKAGEQYRLSDLLYSLMLESHNDVAVAIAEHVGGSVEGFATMMNEKAKELGANHTNFVTPNGLDAEGHYTTAYDLALISSYAIENDTFLQIVQTPSHTFHEQTSGRSFTVNNKDKFLTSYKGAIGIKTGFTSKAGYCFVGAVKREEKTLVSVVLACGWPPNKSYKWKDTTELMNYGVEQYNLKEILTKGVTFQQIPVTDSIEGGGITPYANESVALLLREGEQVELDLKLPKTLAAPVKKEATIGELTIYINNEIYKVLPLYSMENRSKITYEYILKKIMSQYFLLFTG